MSRPLWILPLLLAGCSSDEKYIVVTVNARPAVHDIAMLRVTLSNAGSMRTEDLPVGSSGFPASFSISPEGRTGDLGISIEAYDKDSGLIGRGTTQSTIETASAAVQLDTTDFVVNTEYADDQKLTNYYDSNGFQLAATPDGTWTAVYSAACSQPCNVFGRRFDVSARPMSSVVAAGVAGFPLSTRLTNSLSTPAVANNGTTTLAVWNSYDNPGYSIQCRALDAAGAAVSDQLLLSSDDLPFLVSVAALPNGNFAIAWDGQVTNRLIRTAIVKPNCTLLAAAGTASTTPVGISPSRSHVAVNGSNILYAWMYDNTVHVRAAGSDGVFAGADTQLVAKTATEQVEFVRVAPLGAGFAVVVRWGQITGLTGPGRLDLYRTNNLGVVMGAPVLISDRSGSDFDSQQSFGLARGTDGSVLVVWHSCNEKGDGSGCGVFGRLISPGGVPLGSKEFVIPTTTTSDQTGPSAVALPDGAYAVAWTDKSNAPPDTSGTAVRARIIYPTADGGL